jgi:hypothetical protein
VTGDVIDIRRVLVKNHPRLQCTYNSAIPGGAPAAADFIPVDPTAIWEASGPLRPYRRPLGE